MKLILSLFSPLLFFIVVSGTAQTANVELSMPVDLPMVGVNKVLCMRNGNTVLFHFEPAKGITIKIFDGSRKEIVSRKELCRILDVFVIQEARFKGMFDINNEAVLFFDQENKASKHCLIRLRFNSNDGSLIEEKMVAESKAKDKTMKFYVIPNKEQDSYAILFSTIKNYPKVCDVFMVYFNKRHESLRELQLDVDRKNYDFIDVVGAESVHGGNLVTLGMYKLLINGTVSHGEEYDPTNNEYDHHIKMYYIPADSGAIKTKVVDVSPDVYPFHTYCSYNPFASALNVLLLGYKDAVLRYGLELIPAGVIQDVFLKTDENDFSVNPKWINNTMATQYLKQKRDTSSIFKGIPLKLMTNQNGLSTLVSEAFTRYLNVESSARPNLYETYLGNMCVTQFDDDGNEMWGVVLPKSQYYKSYNHYYYANQVASRWHDQALLGDQPGEVYDRQFVSFNTYTRGRNTYLIFNDNDKNKNSTIEKPGDTVFAYTNINAFYYTINNKKEVTRTYLYGAPAAREYMCSFIEGADFDDTRGIYASLVQYKKGENVTLKMAWRKLD